MPPKRTSFEDNEKDMKMVKGALVDMQAQYESLLASYRAVQKEVVQSSKRSDKLQQEKAKLEERARKHREERQELVDQVEYPQFFIAKEQETSKLEVLSSELTGEKKALQHEVLQLELENRQLEKAVNDLAKELDDVDGPIDMSKYTVAGPSSSAAK